MSDAAPSQPFSDEEQRAWFLLLSVLIWLPATLDAELQQNAELSHSEYQVLWGLSISEHHTMRMSTLADAANITQSHLSRIAARLEKRSWIQRTPDPGDGRYTLARLTEQGCRKVSDCAPGYTAAFREHVLDRLRPEQIRQLDDICTSILEPIRPDCAHRIPSGPGPDWHRRLTEPLVDPVDEPS